MEDISSLYPRLDEALDETAYLWRPQPFLDPYPAWLERYPHLLPVLMALSDEAVDDLNNQPGAATKWLSEHLPEEQGVRFMHEALALPEASESLSLFDLPTHWAWEVPGKKQAQIMALVRAMPDVEGPLLDWCGGKGHLGRLLALTHQQPVTTLEWDAALCHSGEGLAKRMHLPHHFCCQDALTVKATEMKAKHAVALHACGQLHRHLLFAGVEAGLQRLDVVPCCYYKGVGEYYSSFTRGKRLRLTAQDVRLAVTETVTASMAQRRRQQRLRAWKLGFDAWRREGLGLPYRSFKPLPSYLEQTSFETVLAFLCQRETLALPTLPAHWEARGLQREREVARFSIVRHAFRRAIELWLVFDMASFMSNAGYQVSLRQFCPPSLTPRNLWLSAR